MKKIIALAVTAVVCGLIGYQYYSHQTVTTYLRVLEHQPVFSHRPEIKVQIAPGYENDSVANDTELQLYHTMQELWEKERQKSTKKSDEAMYRNFRDDQRCLIKLTHKRSFNMKKFRELVAKGGLNSYKVEKYCKDNDVSLSIYPLLSKF